MVIYDQFDVLAGGYFLCFFRRNSHRKNSVIFHKQIHAQNHFQLLQLAWWHASLPLVRPDPFVGKGCTRPSLPLVPQGLTVPVKALQEYTKNKHITLTHIEGLTAITITKCNSTKKEGVTERDTYRAGQDWQVGLHTTCNG